MPAASMLALGGLLVTASPTALQDMAALVAGADGKLRWQAYLAAAPHGSVHTASLGFAGQAHDGAAGVRLASLGDPAAIAAQTLRRELGKDRQTVNREPKADLLMTRVARAPAKRQSPASRQPGRVEDFFSAHGSTVLTKVGLRPPRHGDPAELMLAYARFLKPQPELDVGVMLANRRRSPYTVAAADESVAPTLVAYAPSERHVDAPFEAVIGRQPRMGPDAEAEIELAALPRMRPDPLDEEDGIQRHSWASKPLPDDVHDKEQQLCLAQAIYFEARGESPLGQAAVAQVVLNRVKNPAYPKSICGVVYQNQTWRNRCQFSFACDGRPERIRSQSAWKRAKDLARDVTNGKVWLRAVGDSTHYHATYVKPRWARYMKRTERIGRHIFYRTHGGGLS